MERLLNKTPTIKKDNIETIRFNAIGAGELKHKNKATKEIDDRSKKERSTRALRSFKNPIKIKEKTITKEICTGLMGSN
ncbi:hypothetical protein GCM10022394_14240 [Zobellella aerophila]|uniref:Uncharacterized protein n=1 Tax=Zobellella aerophila TaxID=870480 RepID=A0ABP6VKH6_9GAMM